MEILFELKLKDSNPDIFFPICLCLDIGPKNRKGFRDKGAFNPIAIIHGNKKPLFSKDAYKSFKR